MERRSNLEASSSSSNANEASDFRTAASALLNGVADDVISGHEDIARHLDNDIASALRATGQPYACLLFIELLAKTYETEENAITPAQLSTCEAAIAFLNDHLGSMQLMTIMSKHLTRRGHSLETQEP